MSSKKIKSTTMKAAEKIGGALELPPGTLTSSSHIEISSNREAFVDGCRGIIDYDEDHIKVNIGNGTACFFGRGLEIKSLSAHQAVIRGFIMKIEFNV